MHEAGFEDSFCDDAKTWGEGHEDHHLGLGVGGEARVGEGGDIHGFQPAAAAYGHGQAFALHLHVGFAEFVEDGVQVIRPRSLEGDFAVGGGGGDGKGFTRYWKQAVN